MKLPPPRNRSILATIGNVVLVALGILMGLIAAVGLLAYAEQVWGGR